MLSGALNKTEKDNKVRRGARSEGANFFELFRSKYGATYAFNTALICAKKTRASAQYSSSYRSRKIGREIRKKNAVKAARPTIMKTAIST